jgi:ABC-type lipoprotein export system ATPase subunit
MQLLRDLTVELRKTAIVVTHDPRIEAFADRILVMESGRMTPQSHMASAYRA